jgi:hypothetical protein
MVASAAGGLRLPASLSKIPQVMTMTYAAKSAPTAVTDKTTGRLSEYIARCNSPTLGVRRSADDEEAGGKAAARAAAGRGH